MSTAKFDTLQNAAGTVSVPVNTVVNGSAKAWVNFNGTTSPGTIHASFNVSSVTRNNFGRYTVNFSTAMPDTNYAVGGSFNSVTTGSSVQTKNTATTTSCTFNSTSDSNFSDYTNMSFFVFR
jgi:hypothetical protein